MGLLGIDFISLDEPFHRKLEALAAGAWFLACTFGGYISSVLCMYLLFTRIWWLILAYLCWIYIDRDTCDSGGRPVKWVQELAWWRYLKEYFSAHLQLVPDFKLDMKKNYLFCCFPHGVLPAGPYTNISYIRSDIKKLYPQAKMRVTALKQLLLLPFTRELGLALGGISCSAKSLHHVLTKPEGGYCVTLLPGGAEEAMYASPGRYKFVVKKRKGFTKVALRSGASLVPVITFREPDLFDQVQTPLVFIFQKFVKYCTGFTPVIFLGCGFFQSSFGFIPRRKRLTTVVGMPIDVARNDNPTNEQIDELHQKFVEELKNLFEKYKYDYLENPEETRLELD